MFSILSSTSYDTPVPYQSLFFTGENGRKTRESSGMGLYLANEVCRKLGHDLVITSEVGEGTAVAITFKK